MNDRPIATFDATPPGKVPMAAPTQASSVEPRPAPRATEPAMAAPIAVPQPPRIRRRWGFHVAMTLLLAGSIAAVFVWDNTLFQMYVLLMPPSTVAWWLGLSVLRKVRASDHRSDSELRYWLHVPMAIVLLMWVFATVLWLTSGLVPVYCATAAIFTLACWVVFSFLPPSRWPL